MTVDYLDNDENTLNTGEDVETYHQEQMNKLQGLPDKTPGSNYDRFHRAKNALAFLMRQNAERIGAWHNIDLAQGLALDDIGDDWDEPRRGLDDPAYRFNLKTKIAQAHTNGTFNDIVAALASALLTDKSNIKLVADYHFDGNGKVSGEPNTLDLQAIPLENLPPKVSIETLVDRISNIRAAGIGIKAASLSISMSAELYVGSDFAVNKVIDLAGGDDTPASLNIMWNTNVYLETDFNAYEHIEI